MLTKAILIQQIADGPKPSFTFFWGHTGHIQKACLSQWFPCKFKHEGIIYTSTEQWMMAEKARLFNDESTLLKILASSSPKEVKALGRKVTPYNDALWKKESRNIVLQGNLLKFEQNPELRSHLKATGDTILVEASPYDKIWGIGLEANHPHASNPTLWPGENQLGFCLIEARSKL
jgi:ribA/ribD-fused uncharacterized protein